MDKSLDGILGGLTFSEALNHFLLWTYTMASFGGKNCHFKGVKNEFVFPVKLDFNLDTR